VRTLLIVVSQMGESIVSAMNMYWMACRSSIAKKKKTPEARAVLLVLLQIHQLLKRPNAAKAADISKEKHILTEGVANSDYVVLY